MRQGIPIQFTGATAGTPVGVDVLSGTVFDWASVTVVPDSFQARGAPCGSAPSGMRRWTRTPHWAYPNKARAACGGAVDSDDENDSGDTHVVQAPRRRKAPQPDQANWLQYPLFPMNPCSCPARLPGARIRNWQEHSRRLVAQFAVCGDYPEPYWALPSRKTTPSKASLR